MLDNVRLKMHNIRMTETVKMMTAAEAAVKWGVSVRVVQNACRSGKIPGLHICGRNWMIPSDASKPTRKPRAKGRPSSILSALKSEKKAMVKGALYHLLQVNFTYNSNHIEGSRLTHEQTKWIFETSTIGKVAAGVPVDDIVETVNHFRCVDLVIETAGAALTEKYIKMLHAQLKSGTVDSRKEWFAVGAYKKLDNVVGDIETCPAKNVKREMARLISRYAASDKTLEDIFDFHVMFEVIHPFQDGNGRIGRLIMLKECLKYGHTPFVIAENVKRFYYQGLREWTCGRRERFRDVCGTGQDVFRQVLQRLGYDNLVKNDD